MKDMAMNVWSHNALMATRAVGKNPYVVFLLGGFLGALFFVLFYGTKVIDPIYTDWLLGGEDLKQHFLGWEFYRTDAWSVPLGMIHQLAYPFGISVTFMDSIPLMAIPFKLFNGILPEQFQYFGIWGILCYGLQGGIAALIIRRFSSNILVILLSTILFIVSPMMIARMFSHTALAGHWIVLFAILLFLERRRFAKSWQFIAAWSGVFVLAAAIHPYFLPMVALPFMIAVILTHKTWLPSLAKLVIPPVVGGIFFWLIGGLVVTGGDAGGLGDYAFNLGALYNPLGYSAFLETLPIASASGETLNYLGLGMMLLALIACGMFVYNHRSVGRIRVFLSRYFTWRYLFIALCVLGLIVVAISPRVQWGAKILVDIDLPNKIERAWATFRASGRLFWVVYYLLMIGVIAYVIRVLRGRRANLLLVGILAVVTIVQMVDIIGSPNVQDKHSRFMTVNQGVAYDTKSVEKWSQSAAGKKHMVYLGDFAAEDFFELSDVALKYNLTMNNGYFARSPKEKIINYYGEQEQMLLMGTADTRQNLYITKDKTTAQGMRAAGRMVSVVNGFYVVN